MLNLTQQQYDEAQKLFNKIKIPYIEGDVEEAIYQFDFGTYQGFYALSGIRHTETPEEIFHMIDNDLPDSIIIEKLLGITSHIDAATTVI